MLNDDVEPRSKRTETIDRFRLIFDTTFQFIGLLNADGVMVEINRPALAWVNASHDEVLGKPVWDTPWWKNAGTEVLTQLRAAVREAAAGRFIRYDVTLAAPNGAEHTFDFSLTPISDDRGQVSYLVAEGRDVSEQKRLERALREANQQLLIAQEQARQLAITDDLTGLYNRRGFFILAAQYKKIGMRSKARALLMFADIDGLKAANDAFGHETGDALITLAAKAITQTLRASDLVARLGGDEFAVLASLSSVDSTGLIAARLSSELDALNRQAGLALPLQLSVGFHEFDWADALDLETRVAQADAAMYEQKRRRKDSSAVAERPPVDDATLDLF